MRRKTVEQFITAAQAVHGSLYSYSKSEYCNQRTKVTITCNRCNDDFKMLPAAHVRGKQGCPKCNSLQKHTIDFITQAKAVHGDKFNYEKSVYINAKTKVVVSCPKHGEWEAHPNHHLHNSIGCPSCVSEYISEIKFDSKEDFIDKATKVHGDRYDYSKTIYKGDSHNLEITCREHGVFKSLPSNHKAGRGCPACAQSGFKESMPAIFYILYSDDLVKIGITNNRPEDRAARVGKSRGKPFTVYKSFYFVNGNKAKEIETSVLKVLRQRYIGTDELFEGFTECFKGVELDVLVDTVLCLINKIKIKEVMA